MGIRKSLLMASSFSTMMLMQVQALAGTETSTQTFSSGDQQVTVLELFTSQGCSSCPPAQNWLNGLKDNPKLWKEVIPLAYHVDYWDYIGWKDPFASQANSNRQYRYQQEKGIKTVYTPGFILNGREWRRWYKSKDNIPKFDQQPGKLKASLTGVDLEADFSGANQQAKRLQLNVALLGFDLNSHVNAGENEGKNLKEEFVVLAQTTQLSNNGHWNIKLPWHEQMIPAKTGLAIWVSVEGKQAPIQATGGWLN